MSFIQNLREAWNSQTSNRNLTAAGVGAVSGAVSLVPWLGPVAVETVQGYRNELRMAALESLIAELDEVVDDFDSFINDPRFESSDTLNFAESVILASQETSQRNKSKYFAGCLKSCLESDGELEKQQFLEILKRSSLPELRVLAEIHQRLERLTRRPGRDRGTQSSLVNVAQLTSLLGEEFGPYLVSSAIENLRSFGLFSNFLEWRRDSNGNLTPGSGYDTEVGYTDFSCKFVEFITGSIENEI